VHAAWPTALFNQGHCGCWGADPKWKNTNKKATSAVSDGDDDGGIAGNGGGHDAVGDDTDDDSRTAALLLGCEDVSLKPAGRSVNKPNKGSDSRVGC
jgi:hypothetical protein